MNDEQLQKQFMQLLVLEAQKAGAQSEEDIKAFIDLLGKEKIQQMYAAFVQLASAPLKAALGAKLNYLKELKGTCPEGLELVYFKKGGRICKACLGKKMKQQGGSLDPIKDFKNKRKLNKLN